MINTTFSMLDRFIIIVFYSTITPYVYIMHNESKFEIYVPYGNLNSYIDTQAACMSVSFLSANHSSSSLYIVFPLVQVSI